MHLRRDPRRRSTAHAGGRERSHRRVHPPGAQANPRGGARAFALDRGRTLRQHHGPGARRGLRSSRAAGRVGLRRGDQAPDGAFHPVHASARGVLGPAPGPGRALRVSRPRAQSPLAARLLADREPALQPGTHRGGGALRPGAAAHPGRRAGAPAKAAFHPRLVLRPLRKPPAPRRRDPLRGPRRERRYRALPPAGPRGRPGRGAREPQRQRALRSGRDRDPARTRWRG